jgi:hypothetical protein
VKAAQTLVANRTLVCVCVSVCVMPDSQVGGTGPTRVPCKEYMRKHKC